MRQIVSPTRSPDSMADFPLFLTTQISSGNTARRLTHARKFKSLLHCSHFHDLLAQLSQFSSACYQLSEDDSAAGGAPTLANFVFAAWTVGHDGASAANWPGNAAPP